MSELKTGYSAYDHDKLEAADTMRIERKVYFESQKADMSGLTALPLAELMKLREESAAAEQTVFESLKAQASAWEEQAGKTLLFDKAIEYARIPEVKHTANKWQDEGNDRHTISNRVYKMSYHVYENTRYDKAAQKSIPYSYTLSWNVYTNSPHGYGQAKIAGQDRKVFADRAAMEKYLNGRIKAYEKLFTEISPAIPPEYAEQFRVNGQLLPGYTVEGEEIKQPAADISAAAPRTEPGQETEQFAILIDSRTRFETGEPGGYWLSMPATKEELHKAMRSVGITADNPQDFFIHGYSDREDRHIALPYDMVCAAQVDELNFLAARLETLDASGIAALNAATQRRNGFENIGQLIDFTYNEDFFVHIPEVHTPRELGDYYLNKSGMVQMPAEWKNSIDPTPAMVDKMFQQIIDKGLKPPTAAGAKRVLSVALSHARKYRYIETNAAKDTLTKFGKGDKTPDPYTPEQVKALMQRVEGTVWEMPVILGGLYGMRRSEILGLRWRNVDLENNTFDVTEQLPFKVPPKTKVIEEMAPPKSNGRKLPITELARPFFLKQLAMQEVQKEQAAKDGKPYYDNDLVVAKPDGAPIAASWVSSQFGKLLEDLDMPHIRFHDLRHTAATNMHQLTGDFYTVGEVLGHTLAGIGASLGLSMNFEAVTARYVDVRLERKKEVLDAYHSAVEKAAPEKPKEAEPKKGKRAAKKKHSEIDL